MEILSNYGLFNESTVFSIAGMKLTPGVLTKFAPYLVGLGTVNSLWPSDAVWLHRSLSTFDGHVARWHELLVSVETPWPSLWGGRRTSSRVVGELRRHNVLLKCCLYFSYDSLYPSGRIFQSLKLCNYKSSLGAFTLVGQLLHAIPPLSAQLLAAYGKSRASRTLRNKVGAVVSYLFVHIDGSFAQDKGNIWPSTI